MRLKPPKHLKAAGAALWGDIVRDYGLEDSAGLALLCTACEALDRMRAAQAAIKKHGEIVLDRYGCPKLNPATALEKDSRNGLIAALRGLNLDIEPLRDRVGRPGAFPAWTGKNGRDHDA